MPRGAFFAEAIAKFSVAVKFTATGDKIHRYWRLVLSPPRAEEWHSNNGIYARF